MKRVAIVALFATPLWVLSGVAGTLLGGEHASLADLIAAVTPSRQSTATAAVQPAKGELVAAAKPVAVPAKPLRRPLPPQFPKARLAVAPKLTAAPAEVAVTTTPPPPARPAAPPPTPELALGSTDVLAPQKPLEPVTDATAAPSNSGVLIVVSLASQKAYVFKNGDLWGSSTVSTGRKGKRTPVGRFTILQKQVHHHSTKYDNAPMPYMQRLTWGGVAMHAGHVTGRPASHGCIRLPRAFAKKLYNLTDFDSTTVVVTDKKARSSEEALKAA